MKRHKSPKPTNQVRIIGGQFKRRNLRFVDSDGLRPTPDRLRETLFNWLTRHLQGADVLDVCAGSGVLGFESLSRGANQAVLIEPIAAQATLLKEQATLFCVDDKLTIINTSAERALPTLKKPFDIIFIDPPYALNLWQPLLLLLQKHTLLHKNSLIYLEGDKPLEELLDTPLAVDVLKSGKFGQVYAYLINIT
ncbi:MAG: 16S rRNA (guanine(966)-N(2))-methyltransferase RsmD [Moraxella sp.]|nr:16S rRNA (guanine(966)-N(2))-methyltransferase RsmD [Moraxella sp.]